VSDAELFTGWWNSCICWSGYWSLGQLGARIDLHLRERLIERSGNLYISWIFAAFLSQCLLTLSIAMIVRGVFKLNYRTDKSRRQDFGFQPMGSLWQLRRFHWLEPLRWETLKDNLGDLGRQFWGWYTRQTCKRRTGRN
jgi:hypothetical protein